MTSSFGQTRTRIAARHALIGPDSHVKSIVPGVAGAAVVILFSEAIGAKFAQLLLTFEAGGKAAWPANQTESAGYFMTGGGTVAIGREKRPCRAGAFFHAPAGHAWSITLPARGTQVTLFQKKYSALAGMAPPKPLIGDSARVRGEPFLGDRDARLRVLLPDEPAYDMAINVFTYQPGATLPFVETHVMEHGLIMLAGQGIYRLENSWYPVQAGDAIWMAPYCPQWFAATGKAPAAYLYYKDVNRPPL